MMNNWILAFASVIGGAGITLFTRLFNSTPHDLVGAVWYGLPFTWIRRYIVAPQYFPWHIAVSGLIADLAFWILAFALILLLARRYGR
jgi:hypothetical protein